MTAYSYKALTPEGQVSKGIVEGESERQVRNLLRQRRLKPMEVSPARGGLRFTLPGMSKAPTLAPAQLALLTRQLATLVQAGVPLDEALGATARQAPVAATKSLLMQIRAKVVAGHSLAASLAEFPAGFSELYRAMVRAGEHAGQLGPVLERLADHIERRQALQQKVQMALIYPTVLLLVALGVITLLMLVVMPDLVDLFARTETALPLLTRVLIALSAFLAAWWWLLLVLALALWTGLRAMLRQEHWRKRRDRVLLRLPLVSRLVLASATARFAATLSILTSSGVALVEALGIAAGVMGNLCLQAECARVAVAVREGGSLARALEDSGHFPPVLVQMVASGEGSGALEGMLGRAAQAQERELEAVLGGLLKIMEPAIIVLMAVVVGAVVMAVLLPVMQMNTLVQ